MNAEKKARIRQLADAERYHDAQALLRQSLCMTNERLKIAEANGTKEADRLAAELQEIAADMDRIERLEKKHRPNKKPAETLEELMKKRDRYKHELCQENKWDVSLIILVTLFVAAGCYMLTCWHGHSNGNCIPYPTTNTIISWILNQPLAKSIINVITSWGETIMNLGCQEASLWFVTVVMFAVVDLMLIVIKPIVAGFRHTRLTRRLTVVDAKIREIVLPSVPWQR